jgi:hypothetical protein
VVDFAMNPRAEDNEENEDSHTDKNPKDHIRVIPVIGFNRATEDDNFLSHFITLLSY